MIVTSPFYLSQWASEEAIMHANIDVLAAMRDDMVRRMVRAGADHGFAVHPRHLRWEQHPDKEKRLVELEVRWMPLDSSKVELVGGHVDGWFVSAHRNFRGYPPGELHVGERLVTGYDGIDWMPLDPYSRTVKYGLYGIDTRGPHWVYRQVARQRPVPHTGSS